MEQTPIQTDQPNSVLGHAAIQRGTRLNWAHWLVVALSLVLTVGAWYFSLKQVEQKNLVEFERLAGQVLELVQERMQLYENALWGGVAYFDANGGEVSHSQWLVYASSLHMEERYPGINGIGVIYNIKPENYDAYLWQQRLTRPGYEVHPKHDQTEYWPITYIEPVEINQKAVGLDMAFEANRYSGVLRARDTGEAQVTGPITLVQDAKQTPGFLFYAPFYQKSQKPETLEERRQETHGVTYAPFIMSRLMNGTLASQNRQVRVEIRDEDVLLFDDKIDTGSAVSDRDPSPMFQKTIDLPMYGRTWSFDIESSLSFRKANSNSQPYIILVGGLIIDSLLLGLFLFLAQANRRAVQYADDATLALRQESERLLRSNRDLEQFAYVASHDLKAPLRGIYNLATWIEENIRDKMDEETREYMSLLKSRISRLEALLAGLLEYSRIGRSEQRWREVDMNKMVASIADLHAAEAQGFQVKYDLPKIMAPEVALEQVLRNLISNAIKHHDKDKGIIEVTCRQEANFNVFTVADDGPGIPVEFQEKVFKMFQTLKPRDEVEGSGMGLAIVKKHVEQVGGEIWIEAGEKERGLRISVSVPADK